MRAAALIVMGAVAFATPSFAQSTVSSANQAVAIAGGGGSGPFSGSHTVRSAPSGSNYLAIAPCGQGASLDVSWIGARIAGSAGGEADGCSVDRRVVILAQMGEREAALSYLMEKDPVLAKVVKENAARRAAAPPNEVPGITECAQGTKVINGRCYRF